MLTHGGQDPLPLRLRHEPAGHCRADQKPLRCGDLSGAGQQDKREDYARGHCLAEPPPGGCVSLRIHGCHPLQGQGRSSLCDQGCLCGAAHHYGGAQRPNTLGADGHADRTGCA